MSSKNQVLFTDQIAGFFRALSQPARIDILLAIGADEACVCHLEAALGQRQAYISQHLMALRDAGILTGRREGRFIFYRLADDRLLPLMREAAGIMNLDPWGLTGTVDASLATCSCPHCTPDPTILITPESITGTAA